MPATRLGQCLDTHIPCARCPRLQLLVIAKHAMINMYTNSGALDAANDAVAAAQANLTPAQAEQARAQALAAKALGGRRLLDDSEDSKVRRLCANRCICYSTTVHISCKTSVITLALDSADVRGVWANSVWPTNLPYSRQSP